MEAPLAATVEVDGVEHLLRGAAVLRFGREPRESDGVVGLDPADTGISRLALEISLSLDGAMIRNLSTKIPVYVDAAGSGRLVTVRPGGRFLATDRMGVEIRGSVRTHRIEVIPETARQPTITTPAFDGVDTQVTFIECSDGELDALTALFHGYLRQFPRRTCQPASYAEAGRLLGLPSTTVRRRIEKVRERLAQHGIFFEGPSAREELAGYVLDTGLLTPGDLRRLDYRQGRGDSPSG